jgi:hypothetical protein
MPARAPTPAAKPATLEKSDPTAFSLGGEAVGEKVVMWCVPGAEKSRRSRLSYRSARTGWRTYGSSMAVGVAEGGVYDGEVGGHGGQQRHCHPGGAGYHAHVIVATRSRAQDL